jgi:hypothetical protein
MRSIVLFQTFANIVLAATLIFLVHQIDRKVEEISGVERLAAKSLEEATLMNATLTEILATLNSREIITPSAGGAVEP